MKFDIPKEFQKLRERNEVRLKEAKEKLGTIWLLHPVNKIQKKSFELIKTIK